jgi:hypothetical protein
LKKYTILFLEILFLSCNYPHKSDNILKIDSSNNEELKNILRDFEGLYSNPVNIDTSFTWGLDSFRLLFKHYSLADSSIVVPAKYVQKYGLDKFTAHTFESRIHLYKNGNEVLSRKIDKNDFIQYLDSSLLKYAVILYPNVEVFPDSININYSMSIPLTDVGKSMRATITEHGLLEFNAQ